MKKIIKKSKSKLLLDKIISLSIEYNLEQDTKNLAGILTIKKEEDKNV